uniref:ZP domain-containing protein n=1 Tax=Romanomermis culicivorax TaxID=13658 RepID=A0A915KLT3_ROMCU
MGYGVGKAQSSMQTNTDMDSYEFNCESQFRDVVLCTSEGTRFVVNTKEPYTGANYAQECFPTCNRTVEKAKHVLMICPPPTVSSDCGTVLK